jgi:hypothetical protein
MWYARFAELVVLLHVTFILFVVFGGLLVLWWPKMPWLHLPAVAWGLLVEFTGSVCPLTPLENWLREQSGQTGYHSDFIAFYVLPILYPDDLTRGVQIGLGIAALSVNLALYGWLWHRPREGFEPGQ